MITVTATAITTMTAIADALREFRSAGKALGAAVKDSDREPGKDRLYAAHRRLDAAFDALDEICGQIENGELEVSRQDVALAYEIADEGAGDWARDVAHFLAKHRALAV